MMRNNRDVIKSDLKSSFKIKLFEVRPYARRSSVLGLRWNVTGNNIQVFRSSTIEDYILSLMCPEIEQMGLLDPSSVQMRRLQKSMWNKNGER